MSKLFSLKKIYWRKKSFPPLSLVNSEPRWRLSSVKRLYMCIFLYYSEVLLFFCTMPVEVLAELTRKGGVYLSGETLECIITLKNIRGDKKE